MKVGVFLTPWREGGDGSDPTWRDVHHRARLSEEIAQPLKSSSEDLAAVLDGFSRVGIDHLQVVLDPNTVHSNERFGLALEAFRRSSGAGCPLLVRRESRRVPGRREARVVTPREPDGHSRSPVH